jgi:peroxiredoxin
MGQLPDQSFPTLSRQEFAWLRSVLTESQREKLNQLLGKPFDFTKVTLREAKAPEFTGVDAWINSPPLTLASLRGKVVVVDFWTFGCINCIHNLPHYRDWYASLPRGEVAQIGIHTPETAGEHDLEHLKREVKAKRLSYPIAVDNERANWTAWGNNTWPAMYLIDKQGYIRYWWYGELNWQGATGEPQMRARIQQLLAEPATPPTTNEVAASVPRASN